MTAIELTAPPSPLAAFVHGVDRLNETVGRVVAWLTLGTVVVCFATVYLRYAVGVNFTWLQEIYVWQHATVILVGAGYTMLTGGFVRVDIFYANMTARRRAMVDLFGTVAFFMPFMGVVAYYCWRAFVMSYGMDEGSENPGGLPNLWLLKSALVAFCALVLLQGLALAARSILVLQGQEQYSPSPSSH
jgi:TRAP-type mannitol/chloroaromatic compound transport system permease small subunit